MPNNPEKGGNVTDYSTTYPLSVIIPASIVCTRQLVCVAGRIYVRALLLLIVVRILYFAFCIFVQKRSMLIALSLKPFELFFLSFIF